MRFIPGLMVLMLLLSRGAANAQSFELNGAGGPTITDAGNSFAAGAGFSPTSRLTLAFNVERTHLSSRTNSNEGVVSSFRGGTLLLGTAELRFTPLGRHRVGPYGLAGFAAGVSRPNVNATFPDPVTNDVRATFVGGGLQVPLNARTRFFAEARMMFGAEGSDGIVAVAPLRAGLAWRF